MANWIRGSLRLYGTIPALKKCFSEQLGWYDSKECCQRRLLLDKEYPGQRDHPNELYRDIFHRDEIIDKSTALTDILISIPVENGVKFFDVPRLFIDAPEIRASAESVEERVWCDIDYRSANMIDVDGLTDISEKYSLGIQIRGSEFMLDTKWEVEIKSGGLLTLYKSECLSEWWYHNDREYWEGVYGIDEQQTDSAGG